MENRLNRLQFEEIRSKKMQQLAQERAEKMIQARNRHFVELVNKKNFYAQQKIQTEKQRDLFNKQREETKQRIKEARFDAMKGHFRQKDEVLQVNSEVKEQQIEHEKRQIEEKKVIRLQALISKQAAKVNKDLAWKKKLDEAN